MKKTTPLSSEQCAAQQLLYSVMLGGSVHDLPNGWEHKGPNFIQEQYEQHCVEGGEPGTGNATGNSGHTGQGTGNATGNSGNPNRP